MRQYSADIEIPRTATAEAHLHEHRKGVTLKRLLGLGIAFLSLNALVFASLLLLHFDGDQVTTVDETTADDRRQFIDVFEDQDKEQQMNATKAAENGMRFATKVAAVNTQSESDWCRRIIAGYDHQSGIAIEPFLKQQNFVSQMYQDWFLFSSIFVHMRERGVYVDLAANTWKSDSNTYFLDKCLSWPGVCIEAEPLLLPKLRQRRSCDVVPTCVWEEPKAMTFLSNGGNGMTGLKNYNKLGNRGTEVEMQCTTLQSEFDRRRIRHIHYLSLDIEGSELQALRGIDFERTTVGVLTVEMSKNYDALQRFMREKGYVHKMQLMEDAVFVHSEDKHNLGLIDAFIAKNSFKTYDAKSYKNIVAVPIGPM